MGDTIAAHFSARTLDGKPVEGQGELTLLQIAYKDGRPVETPVQTWQLDTNAEGQAQQPITASQAGQYRLSYKVTAGEGRRGEERGEISHNSASTCDDVESAGPTPPPSVTIEGGYVFTIVGEGFDGPQFRFNHLELIPDKREYAPGDTVKLQINTDRPGGTVLLFARPANGVYLPPKVIRLDGKSTFEEIGVVQKDMPNFFVEAVTIADGQTFTETREIVVPPEKRILNVEDPAVEEVYKPGEKARVKIKLTDFAGQPFVGSTVVAIYDKSVEYISGGSNVPDIKEFFWKWRRQHSPQTESSLGRWFQNLVPPKTIGMGDLGVFGGTVAERRAAGEAEGSAAGRGIAAMGDHVSGRCGTGEWSFGDGMLKAAAPMAAPPDTERPTAACRDGGRRAAPGPVVAADDPHASLPTRPCGSARSRPPRTARPRSRSICPRISPPGGSRFGG